MTKKHNNTEPNPLNLYEARCLTLLPPYFYKTCIPQSGMMTREEIDKNIDALKKWIHSNLRGRYSVIVSYEQNPGSKFLKKVISVGFENSRDLTYFNLAGPSV